MCFTTVISVGYMTQEFYCKRPMQMNELKLNLIIDENPHLVKALDRSVNVL